MLEPVTREISGTTYEIRQLPAASGWPVFLRLNQLLAGGLEEFFSRPDAEADVGALTRALGRVLRDVQPADLEAVVLPLLAKVSADGRLLTREVFSAHFAGRFGHLFAVLAAAVEVNYLDFFTEARAVLQSAAAQMALRAAAGQQSAEAAAGLARAAQEQA
jgi:hypothetical protein